MSTYRDTSGNGLVGVAVFVRGETARVWVAQLAASACTPRVKMALCQDGNRVRLSAGYLLDLHLAESDDKFWLGLVRAAVLVLWHT